MFARLISALREIFAGSGEAKRTEDRQQFEKLERHAPIKRAESPTGSTDNRSDASGFLCREAVLGRDQRVAGYQFMLHEGTRNRIRTRGRRIHHVYAEVLARNIAQADIGRLLGHRTAFLDIPDSFLEHPAILDLPPANTVLVITTLDEHGAPEANALLATVQRIRAAGYRIGAAAADLIGERAFLLPETDFVTLRAAASDPAQLKTLIERIKSDGGKVTLIARDLPSQDDFQLCLTLGAALFQGPFITSREDWRGNRLGPNTARLAELIARLRRDADTAELVELLKQDAALSLRLMRYINSAAVGLHQEVASIERALLQLGRDKLYRWLMLLLYGADKGSARSAAVLENALVRARLMELLGEGRPAAERDALYLVGLLSLVDVVLQMPIAEAMASLATAPEIEAAVVRGEGPMADLLQLVIACESADSDALQNLAERCGINPALASRRHLDAFAWAMEINA
jgi:EAL and modified HD-GYP domain-containing signal transduction protein